MSVYGSQHAVAAFMANDHEVLTLKELCELLRVHRSTAYRLLREGKIPSFRIGSDWRFRKDVITRWLAEKSMRAEQLRKIIESDANGRGVS